MKISGLAAASGVPLPTIKFYLRAGLLPPGHARAINQADYGTEHLRRLRLIRALGEVGRVPLRQVRVLLAAIDDDELPLSALLDVAQRALAGQVDAQRSETATETATATTDVDRFLDLAGWTVNEDAPARQSMAHAITTLRGLGWDVSVEDFLPYCRALDGLAARAAASAPPATTRSEAVERLIVGTAVIEAILAGVRRLAQEAHYREAHLP